MTDLSKFPVVHGANGRAFHNLTTEAGRRGPSHRYPGWDTAQVMFYSRSPVSGDIGVFCREPIRNVETYVQALAKVQEMLDSGRASRHIIAFSIEWW